MLCYLIREIPFNLTINMTFLAGRSFLVLPGYGKPYKLSVKDYLSYEKELASI